MATSNARRPLPALAFLLALSLLTALVWWRVLHRSDTAKASVTATCTASAPATPTISAVPAPAAVTVTVLNSTQKTGLAAQVTGFLAADGFKVGTPANDLTARAPVTGIAEIRYGPTGAAAAKLLSFYVPGATLVPDGRTDASVDLAVGAKYTAVLSTASVASALAAAKVSQLPPPTSGSAAASSTVSKSSAAASGSSTATKSTASSSATSTTSC
jgi:hypothetical protein